MDAAEARTELNQSPQPEPSPALVDGLSSRERDILLFEQQWWRYAGAKEQAIRDAFAMSPTRYYQLLNQLLDKQEALSAYPMLVKRLRKVRAMRQRNRAARRLGIELR